MISVYFNCSSPYVGYTLRKADYIGEKMEPCDKKEMTEIWYKVFDSSGSYTVFGSFGGKRYFHSRQSHSETTDEHGRRLYVNVAFAADENSEDAMALNRIAAYAFFEEEKFYADLAQMIVLTREGFTVKFDMLKAYLARFSRDLIFSSEDYKAKNVYNSLMANRFMGLQLIVFEATESYFIKQIGYDFGGNMKIKLSENEAKDIATAASVSLACEMESDNHGDVVAEEQQNTPETDPVEETERVEDSEQLPKNTESGNETAESEPLIFPDIQKDLTLQYRQLQAELGDFRYKNTQLSSKVKLLEKKVQDLLAENEELKTKLTKKNKTFAIYAAIGLTAVILVSIIIKIISLKG